MMKTKEISKYTKEQRHEIYKKALIHFEEWRNFGSEFGMCYSIRAVIGSPYINFEKDFPEFYAKKPKNRTTNQYWWSTHNKQKRINIFNELIKKTES